MEAIYRIPMIIDIDAMYAECSTYASTFVIDTIDFSQPNYAELLEEKMFSGASEAGLAATCACGEREMYYYGRTCPDCGEKIVREMEVANGHLLHKSWFSAPPQIPGFLQPTAYMVLHRWLGGGRNAILDCILNPKAPLHRELEGLIDGRGFSYFHQHFDRLMDHFLNHNRRTASSPTTPYMRLFIQENRHKIFCRYLPVMSSSLHTVTVDEGYGKNRRRKMDQNSEDVYRTASTLSYLRFSPHRTLKQQAVEERLFEAYHHHIKYLQDIMERDLSTKYAIPRKHVYGARLHLTFRGVVTPITGPHRFDDLHVPYKVALNIFRTDICGRLMRQGATPAEAQFRHSRALTCFDDGLYRMMMDFIKESPFRGVPVFFNRNPTLQFGSIMLLFLVFITPDIDAENLRLSPLALTASNTDFDGDELNGCRIPEASMAKEFMSVHPANLIPSTNGVEVGNSIKLPSQVIVTANSFLGMV